MKSFTQAVEWYSAAAETVQEDECGEFDAIMENPLYELKAKMAELYLEGGYGLEKDPSYAGKSLERFATRDFVYIIKSVPSVLQFC